MVTKMRRKTDNYEIKWYKWKRRKSEREGNGERSIVSGAGVVAFARQCAELLCVRVNAHLFLIILLTLFLCFFFFTWHRNEHSTKRWQTSIADTVIYYAPYTWIVRICGRIDTRLCVSLYIFSIVYILYTNVCVRVCEFECWSLPRFAHVTYNAADILTHIFSFI